ncbi:ATP-binding cassette domain-containing protein [Streptomyces halstedii]|uniref:hypothetical protein n=1 Tax=Streptomyces halstedii TaxID=1944 RepID=UPI003825770E
MAAALPRMVLRTSWEADRRVVMGGVAAELGQGVTAGWGLVAVNGVLAQLFADGPTVDKLRDAPPSPVSTSRPVPSILMQRSLRLRGCRPWPREGHAVVLVTHRLAATMHADHIYVLDRGSVVEDGTHEDLMAIKGGLYQGMLAVQAAQYGIVPAPNGVPCPRGTQPTGHETAS